MLCVPIEMWPNASEEDCATFARSALRELPGCRRPEAEIVADVLSAVRANRRVIGIFEDGSVQDVKVA